MGVKRGTVVANQYGGGWYSLLAYLYSGANLKCPFVQLDLSNFFLGRAVPTEKAVTSSKNRKIRIRNSRPSTKVQASGITNRTKRPIIRLKIVRKTPMMSSTLLGLASIWL